MNHGYTYKSALAASEKISWRVEDVHAAAPTVHGDADARVLEHAGEVEAGELAALIRIEYLRLAVAGPARRPRPRRRIQRPWCAARIKRGASPSP